MAPHAFQARPSDQQRKHTGQHRKAAKGRADERQGRDHHFFSGRIADTTPSITVATSA
jgi:hypothetical protein